VEACGSGAGAGGLGGGGLSGTSEGDDAWRFWFHVHSSGANTLAEALGKPDDSVKSACIYALARIGDARAIPALVDLAGREGAAEFPGSLRGQSIWAIALIGGPEAVAPLLKVIASRAEVTPEQRGSAAWALGQLGQPQAVEPLLALLASDVPRVRWAAALALGRLGDRRATAPIARLLREPDIALRADIAAALADLADPAAVAPLAEALADTSYRPREAVAEALGNLWDSGAIPALAPALRDQDQHVCEAAAEALGSIRDPSAVPHLTAALADKSWGRSSAVENQRTFRADESFRMYDFDMGHFARPRTYSALIVELNSRDPFAYHREALDSLGHLNPSAAEAEGVLKALDGLRTSDDLSLRDAACLAARRIRRLAGISLPAAEKGSSASQPGRQVGPAAQRDPTP
jgi:HEAT repeat protein